MASESMREVRSDFIDQARYTSKEFAELENTYLWPKVWQWACRLEEIPLVGDYVVYDIADQSVVVVRSAESEVKAFHNVCPHRGRRLYSGRGHITKFHCIFHAWQWNLNGENTRVLDHEQWDGCPGMSTEELALAEVHVAEWAGFVFINMAEEPESFDEFIEPAREILAPLAIDKMRYCWHNIIDVECNWKVSQEAFMESYHVWGTHPQFLAFVDERNTSKPEGKHGKHTYTKDLPPGMPSRRLKKSPDMTVDEIREGFAGFINCLGEQVGNKDMDGQMTARSIKASKAALASCPEGTPIEDFIGAAVMAMKEAADADGAYFPMPTMDERWAMGEDWNVFPTLSIVHSFDGTLIFRAKPRGDNPNHATIEMISLLHYGPGKEPKYQPAHLDDWRSQHKDYIPPLLVQDLINMEDVQKGMHSIGLKALRPNPVQEVQITHFHKVINQYVYGE